MSFYITGIEGMPKLLDCAEEPMLYFKRRVYPDAFKERYQSNIETFNAIENGYNSVIDKEQFITNMAEALVEHAVSKFQACKGKRKQEAMMMDLNMAMAVFVFPMILEFKGNSSRPLVEKLLIAWKREFPKTNLQAADYEFIEKGFHKKFCYITTAVCDSFGKSDDCYELSLLRDYRDTYLSTLPNGEDLIHSYYDIAPTIVKHINQLNTSKEVYQGIWTDYLKPCIELIEHQELEACSTLYQKMVWDLKDRYFS